MRRRSITVLLVCAATAMAAAVPAGAQDAASTTAPGGAAAGASTTAPPGSSALPAAPATSAAPATTTMPPAATSAAPATSAVPGAASSQSSRPAKNDSSRPLILLALVGALLLLAAGLWGAAKWWAWEPTWWLRSRHATGEAGWRTSAAWAEFRDWLRLGR